MTTLLVVLSAIVGLGAGVGVQGIARRYVPPVPPMTAGDAGTAGTHGAGREGSGSEGAEADRSAVAVASPRHVGIRIPPPLPALATAGLWSLAALRFGPSWQLPAFLVLAAVGVLLAVIDLEHRLLPNRIVGPATAAGAALLAVAAAVGGTGADLLRAVLAAAVLFAVYLVMALVAPSGLGMGDVKLAGLLGLYLGWLGWGPVVVGAFAGFVVQALVALVLLAARRIGLRGELPFGPAMLAGAALAIAWPGARDLLSLVAAGGL